MMCTFTYICLTPLNAISVHAYLGPQHAREQDQVKVNPHVPPYTRDFHVTHGPE